MRKLDGCNIIFVSLYTLTKRVKLGNGIKTLSRCDQHKKDMGEIQLQVDAWRDLDI